MARNVRQYTKGTAVSEIKVAFDALKKASVGQPVTLKRSIGGTSNNRMYPPIKAGTVGTVHSVSVSSSGGVVFQVHFEGDIGFWHLSYQDIAFEDDTI